MRVLLVNPRFPTTYWGYQYVLPLLDKQALLPPLGLISLAALLPSSWELRLIDLELGPLRDSDLCWADAVLVGGMHIQGDSMREVVHRARTLGRRTCVGGASPTTAPEQYPEADVVFCGEAEGRIRDLKASLFGSGPRIVEAPDSRPGLEAVPPPRYDLLEWRQYSALSLQYSRGCPFTCEFCDIIEIFGRLPRVKSAEQVLAELEAIHRLGFRGPLFVVDDNFIGHLPAVKKLLPYLTAFQSEHGYPFRLMTEASVNLAGDEALVSSMVQAGFTSVFLGIESPSPEALRSARKTQNLRLDLTRAVDGLTAAGIEVLGGFIAGFDTDTEQSLEALSAFLEAVPIPRAMIGLLQALPGTGLSRRLAAEGRLRMAGDGDTFARPNFDPVMDEEKLVRGYLAILERAYSIEGYLDRALRYIDRVAKGPARGNVHGDDLKIFARTIWRIGVLSPRRRLFWKLLLHAAARARHALPAAVMLSLFGEHSIRYTAETVAPRIRQALAGMRADAAEAVESNRRSPLRQAAGAGSPLAASAPSNR